MKLVFLWMKTDNKQKWTYMLKGKKMLWKKMKQTGGGVPAACMRWCVPENRVSYTVISVNLQISEVYYTNSLIIASAACQSRLFSM